MHTSIPAVAVIGGAIRLLSLVSDRASSRVVFELFRTPRRFSLPDRERAYLTTATPFVVRLSSTSSLKAWRWGEGPVVILMHGWEGRGAQLGAFAQPLVDAGFSVVTFDAPGHGASPGRRSSLPHFTWALRKVAQNVGPVHAVIAHSLGCAAATLAARDGLHVERLVYVAPPLQPADYTKQFGEIFGLHDGIIEGLRTRVEERFLRPWSDYSLAEIAPRMATPLLIVHDRDDKETPWSGGSTLAALWPGATLLTTNGLGHRRVLRDERVVSETAQFITS
ncbi:MAG TPA: alpha/beta fold hydrolase [Thermoanaerobaculia bacterium]